MENQNTDQSRTNKSAMWNHFLKKNDRSVECKYCKCCYKYSNNTTNLKDHLKRKHPETLLPTPNDIEEQNEETRRSSNDNKYHPNSTRKVFLDKLFTKMIAIDMEPLRLSEHEGLREFVRALDSRYEMPSRTTVALKILPRIYNNMRTDLMEIIKIIDHLAITTDMWTSRSNQGVCAVTCHFILKSKLHSCLLEVVNVEGNHDANKLSSVIDTVLRDWHCREKVIAIVTDNAAVMIKVADILKLRHVPCFAHSLNLVIKDVLCKPELAEILNKCKQIVTYFKHSTLASDKLKDAQKNLNKPILTPKQQVETRWNSALLMFRRIIQIREELTLVLIQCPTAPSNLTAAEYSFLGDLEKIFDPIETCTIAVSGDQYATISLILPLIKGLSLALVQMEREELSEPAKVILQYVKNAVHNKLKSYETRTPCIAATLLNPHFKKQGFKTNSDCDRAIACVQREYSNFLTNMSTMLTTESIESNSPEEVAKKRSKLSNLLSFLSEPSSSSTSNISNSTANAIVDIRQYLEKPIVSSREFPIEYWNYSENNLKHIALKYLCIPATSVPAERIFSKAGQIITDRRNRLSNKHLNKMLFINQNRSILEKL